MIEAIEGVNGSTPVDYTPTPTNVTPAGLSDTAILSETARANLLAQEGFSVAEIADVLGINQNTVISEIGVAAASSAQPTVTSITPPTNSVAAT